jgi:hypothetical protein
VAIKFAVKWWPSHLLLSKFHSYSYYSKIPETKCFASIFHDENALKMPPSFTPAWEFCVYDKELNQRRRVYVEIPKPSRVELK